MSYRGVLDKSFALYQGFPTLIPGSPSLSNEALSHDSHDSIFWDALKLETLPDEPSGAPGHKTTKMYKPTQPSTGYSKTDNF